MGIRVALNHKTVYEYDRPVTLFPQIVRLRPAPHCRTPVLSYALRVEPEDHRVNWQQDPHGNFLARMIFPNQTRHFLLEVDMVADIVAINPFDFYLEAYAEKYPFRYQAWEQQELAPYLANDPAGPRLAAFVASIDRSESSTVEFLVNLNRRIENEIRYLVRTEPGVRTVEETLATASGSCRDSGWLLVQTLRHLGLAAQFVSGYLIQLTPEVQPAEGAVQPDKDFVGLHAWAETYIPGAGWIGLDPTSGMLTGEGHIPLAAAREPASAAPVSGLVSPSEVTLRHEMTVTRLDRGVAEELATRGPR